ncbi:MAG TPA: TIGR02281 family clan AA aspartic protease [Rhizomicrobium sp.]|jgi:aspartyl protease family protein
MRFILALALGLCALGSPARADVFSMFETGHPRFNGDHELSVTPDTDGIYYIFADVNGVSTRFVIDTGSDDVVLTRKDAQRAGIDISKLQFSEEFDAASGSGTEADTTVRSIAIGSLAVTDFPVSVEEDGGASLLGMAFLRRMKSVEIRSGRLYLRW